MEDTALQVLKTTILTGWPETKEEVPMIIREYWAYRDELTVQNRVLFKGPRVIIPKSMRPFLFSHPLEPPWSTIVSAKGQRCPLLAQYEQ